MGVTVPGFQISNAQRVTRPVRFGVVLVLVGLLATPAGAADAPFRALSEFERIAYASEDSPLAGTGERLSRVFVVTRGGGTLFTVGTATFLEVGGPTHVFEDLAWTPGAASLAVTEDTVEVLADGRTSLVERLTLHEFPSGPAVSASQGLARLYPSEFQIRQVDALRFTGPGTPQGLRYLMVLRGSELVGLTSIKPDGSGAEVLTPGSVPAAALFSDGRRTVRSTGSGFAVSSTAGGPDKQITNDPTDRAAALSPDETRVAFLRGPDDRPSLGSVTVNGTDLRIIDFPNLFNPRDFDTLVPLRRPVWSPDSSRIGFQAAFDENRFNSRAEFQGIYSIKPDGTDLVKHSGLKGSPTGEMAWGSLCSAFLGCQSQLRLTPAPGAPSGGVSVGPGQPQFELVARPELTGGASIGFLVERYDERGRLRRVGRVPFGFKPRGRPTVRWNLRLAGRALTAGRYRITLRSLGVGGIALGRAAPLDLIVRGRGREPQLRPARKSG